MAALLLLLARWAGAVLVVGGVILIATVLRAKAYPDLYFPFGMLAAGALLIFLQDRYRNGRRRA